MTASARASDGARALTPGLLLVLGMLMTLNPVTASMYLPALGLIGADLDVPIAAVQLALTGFYVGVAAGVLVGGAIADAVGRRAVLLTGLVVLTLAGIVVALAPTIEVLIAGRVLQGIGSSTAVVIVRAIVSDVAKGREAARAFSILMGILAAGPLLAPLLGAVLMQVGWRAVFVGMLALTVVYLGVSALVVPETLPVGRRSALRVRPLLGNYARIARDRAFVGDALAVAFAFGALSVQISASSFVAQDVLGLDEWGYVLMYGAYALAVMGGSWLNAPLSMRFGTRRMLLIGQVTALGTSLVLTALAVLGPRTVWTFLPAILLASASASGILANGTALAMGRVAFAAGTGAALMGCVQFALGAVVSPLGGVLGPHTAVPMAATMTACFAASALAAALSRRA